MKLLGSLAIAIVAAQNKKVPPKTPKQRLNTLSEFFERFTTEVVAPSVGQGYAERLNKRMQKMVTSMGAAYDRPNCGYFDENSKHGGPDPNPHVKPNGKPRNRRDVDDSDDTWFGAQGATDEYCNANEFANHSEEGQKSCCSESESFLAANTGNCGKLRTKGGNKKRKEGYERLSDDPQLKWKQITTGARKWAERYINNCGGQRKNKLISNRTKKVYAKVNEKMGWA